jgi:hypothetical protein
VRRFPDSGTGGLETREAHEEVEEAEVGATTLEHDAVGADLLLGVLPQVHELLGILL